MSRPVGSACCDWTVTYVDLDTSTCDNCQEVCEVIE
jgi:hypothetical protein